MIARSRRSQFQSQLSMRSQCIERKMGSSVSRVSEIKQHKYAEYLGQIHAKNWEEVKSNNHRIACMQRQQDLLKNVISYQSQQIKKSQLQLLKQEYKLEIQRLSEQIFKLHEIRQKSDEDLITAKENFQADYSEQVNANSKLKQYLDKCLAEVAYYRNIIEGKKLGVRLSEIKIAQNTKKINQKMKIEIKYKEAVAKNDY